MTRTPSNADTYYAVIGTTTLNEMDDPTRSQYIELTKRMEELAQQMPGYLGREYARQEAFGISVSYWRSLEDIQAFRTHAEHIMVKQLGRSIFYANWRVRICLVEREYGKRHNKDLLPLT